MSDKQKLLFVSVFVVSIFAGAFITNAMHVSEELHKANQNAFDLSDEVRANTSMLKEVKVGLESIESRLKGIELKMADADAEQQVRLQTEYYQAKKELIRTKRHVEKINSGRVSSK